MLALPQIVSADNAPPTTLKAAYEGKFEVGSAIEDGHLDAGNLRLLTENFTNVTPQNCMKPDATEPQEGRFTFERADAFVAFAREHGLKVNGHTLVWHQQCPDWFFTDGGKPAGRGLVLARLRAHAATLVGHFRGQMESWDVVNEALNDGDDGDLHPSPWLRSIGPEFVAEAFIAAHAADPDAKLYYNDYLIEQPAKRERALRLVHDLRARGAHIDGIGIQGHWMLDQVPFGDIDEAITAFHAAGLQVAISELDLDTEPRRFPGADVGQRETAAVDLHPDGLPADMLQRQAEQYGKLFALFRKHAGELSRVTFWGLQDGDSWLNHWPNQRTNYPLLWGRDLQPKPALGAVLNPVAP